MISSPLQSTKKLNSALIASLLDDAEVAAGDERLLTEIAFLRSRLLPLCLQQQGNPQALIDIPKEVRERWDALFLKLEQAEDRAIAERRPIIDRVREDARNFPGGTPPEELEYLDSVAAHARKESRDLYQDLLDGELTEMHEEENAARSGTEADTIARLRKDLQKRPKPPPSGPGADGQIMN